MALISFFTSRLGRLVAALTLALSILAGTFMYGRKTQRVEDRIEDLEDYKHTREVIDEVDPSPDADAAFERLRNNGWLR